MNKKIKVIELLSEISKGKNPIFRKHGGTYKNSVWTFIISYFDKKMTHEEIVDVLNSEVEILEDEEEIDINDLEDLPLNYKEVSELSIDSTFIDFHNNTRAEINKIIKYLKQLDKKINKEE